jgi:hypothetical protein
MEERGNESAAHREETRWLERTKELWDEVLGVGQQDVCDEDGQGDAVAGHQLVRVDTHARREREDARRNFNGKRSQDMIACM